MVLFFLIGGILFALFLCLLCFPLSLTLHGKRTSKLESAGLLLSWGNPLLLKASMDLQSAKIDVWVLNRFRVFSKGSIDVDVSGTDAKGESRTELASAPETNASHTFSEMGGGAKGASENKRGKKERTKKSPTAEPYGEEPSKIETINIDRKKSLLQRISGIAGRIKGLTSSRAVYFLRQHSLMLKLLRWTRRWLACMLQLFKVRSFSCAIRAGLGEPSETGRLFGYWKGLENALSLGAHKHRRLVIEPAFNEECFEFQGALSLQTSLMRFAALAFVMIATFPYFSTLVVWRKSRKKP